MSWFFNHHSFLFLMAAMPSMRCGNLGSAAIASMLTTFGAYNVSTALTFWYCLQSSTSFVPTSNALFMMYSRLRDSSGMLLYRSDGDRPAEESLKDPGPSRV